jgi:peptidoglycan/LPS O-acetylase OafA/YrhL
MGESIITLKNEPFIGIQLLRFVAALMVVVTHATFYMSTRVDSTINVWGSGTQGVPIFFVISGFVMVQASKSLITRDDGWKPFILSRIIRIVPLYWALNFLKIIQISAVPSLAFVRPDFSNIALSLLFIPSRNVNGAVETFYGVGWTLNFEMFFYFLFALAIFLKARIEIFMGVILIAVAVLSTIRTDSWPAVTTLFNSIVLNFLWGILIAQLLRLDLKIPPIFAFLALCLGLLFIFAFPHAPLIGLQYAMLVGGVVLLEGKMGHYVPKVLIFGGDSSYSLYLVHPMVGVFVAVTLYKLHITSAIIGVSAIIVFSFGVSALTYTYFERPVTQYLKKRLLISSDKLALNGKSSVS